MNINNDENETMVGMEKMVPNFKSNLALKISLAPFSKCVSYKILLDIIVCERKYIKDYEHISSAFKIRMK